MFVVCLTKMRKIILKSMTQNIYILGQRPTKIFVAFFTMFLSAIHNLIFLKFSSFVIDTLCFVVGCPGGVLFEYFVIVYGSAKESEHVTKCIRILAKWSTKLLN